MHHYLFLIRPDHLLVSGSVLLSALALSTDSLTVLCEPPTYMTSGVGQPADTKYWTTVVLMLVQRLRCWANIKTAVERRLLFAGHGWPALTESLPLYHSARLIMLWTINNGQDSLHVLSPQPSYRLTASWITSAKDQPPSAASLSIDS